MRVAKISSLVFITTIFAIVSNSNLVDAKKSSLRVNASGRDATNLSRKAISFASLPANLTQNVTGG